VVTDFVGAVDAEDAAVVGAVDAEDAAVVEKFRAPGSR
jgi:ketosteroid isomerase-like protein